MALPIADEAWVLGGRCIWLSPLLRRLGTGRQVYKALPIGEEAWVLGGRCIRLCPLVGKAGCWEAGM